MVCSPAGWFSNWHSGPDWSRCFGHLWALFENQSKLPLIRMFSKLDKNSKRNSIMVCRHWYDTVWGSFISLLRSTQVPTAFWCPWIPDKAICEPTLWAKYSLSVLDPSLSLSQNHPARNLNRWSNNPSITTYS